jgi:hypothetical protein
MTSATKSNDKSGQVKLSSHDVSVVSAIVQQKSSLPREFLLEYAMASEISSDALEIVKMLLDESFVVAARAVGSTKKAARKNIADEFYRWAIATRLGKSESDSLVDAVRA